jgi:hypothetical protein
VSLAVVATVFGIIFPAELQPCQRGARLMAGPRRRPRAARLL